MPGPNPNPNPNPKPKATKVTKVAKEKEKEKEKKKKVDLREVDLGKLWGWSFSEDSFVKPTTDPEPEENRGDEVVRSILGWDKDIWEKEMEIEKGMKVKDGKDLYYDDDEQLEFEKRVAQYFNWTEKDWEAANHRRERIKEYCLGVDCETFLGSFCDN